MTDIVPTTGGARGAGLATYSDDGRVLDTWYLQPELGNHPATSTESISPAPSRTPPGSAGPGGRTGRGPQRGRARRGDHDRRPPGPAGRHPRRVPPAPPAVHRLVQPNTINLEGIFGLLPTVAWTQLGPVAVEDLPAASLRARAAGTPARRAIARQVPADARLRGAVGGAHRRRHPRAPRRPPGRGHHRHARGARELQRRHPRHRHGRGADHAGRRAGRGLRPRRRARRSWARCRAAGRTSSGSASGA